MQRKCVDWDTNADAGQWIQSDSMQNDKIQEDPQGFRQIDMEDTE